MRICMLGHKRIPSREGGIEIVVEKLATRMVQLGHDVTCYNRGGHYANNDALDKKFKSVYKGVQLRTMPTIAYKGLAAVSSSFFGSLFASFKPFDVVHFHAEGPCAMLWIPKLFGRRCIATIHGLDHRRAKWGKFARFYIMLGEKCAVKYADEIIVLSDGIRKYFKDTYNRETRLIPNGVNQAITREANLITEKYGLKKDEYILYLGRVVLEKGIQYLIEAFKDVQTDKKLVIAGGASDSDSFYKKLKRIAQEDKRIFFTGFVEGQILEELFSNAYVYTLPSELEGMPLSLLEAMNYGNCCLVSDIEECRTVVEDYGVTFKKSDINDLREKLQLLCNDEKLVSFYKEKAADYICEKCDWDKVTEDTLQLYCGNN